MTPPTLHKAGQQPTKPPPTPAASRTATTSNVRRDRRTAAAARTAVAGRSRHTPAVDVAVAAETSAGLSTEATRR
jgi:hypothetical protein